MSILWTVSIPMGWISAPYRWLAKRTTQVTDSLGDHTVAWWHAAGTGSAGGQGIQGRALLARVGRHLGPSRCARRHAALPSGRRCARIAGAASARFSHLCVLLKGFIVTRDMSRTLHHAAAKT